MSAKSMGKRKGGSGAGKIHNADEFADYVHAVTVPMKLVMAAIVVFFIGAIAYCVFARVPVTIDAVAVADSSGNCTCYLKASDRDGIEPGDDVEIAGDKYALATVSTTATCVDETIEEYARGIGGFSLGDYVFLATVDGTVSQGTYAATVIKDYLQPLTVLLSS